MSSINWIEIFALFLFNVWISISSSKWKRILGIVSFQCFDFNAFNRLEIMVVDVGVPADWVKVNVQRMVCIFVFFIQSLVCSHSTHRDLTSFNLVVLQKDCYEVYALVPGLLREEASNRDVIFSFFLQITNGFTTNSSNSFLTLKQVLIISAFTTNYKLTVCMDYQLVQALPSMIFFPSFYSYLFDPLLHCLDNRCVCSQTLQDVWLYLGNQSNRIILGVSLHSKR